MVAKIGRRILNSLKGGAFGGFGDGKKAETVTSSPAPTPGLFGSSTATSTVPAGLFGSSSAGTTGGLFGTPQKPAPTGLFGTPTEKPSSAGLFGSATGHS